MSLGRRLQLATQLGELLSKQEFLLSSERVVDKAEAGRLALEIDRQFIKWGLVEIGGVEIDGSLPGIDTVIEAGPEALVREVVAAIRRECGLTEDERKN